MRQGLYDTGDADLEVVGIWIVFKPLDWKASEIPQGVSLNRNDKGSRNWKRGRANSRGGQERE